MFANVGMRRSIFQYSCINDDRIHCFRDLLYAIKGVKLLAYEPVFYKMIQSFRKSQLGALTTWMNLTFCLFTSFNQAVPGMAAGATFLAYYLLDGSLSPEIIFPTLAYINMLYQPVSQTSLSFSRQFSMWPCWVRIRDFLNSEEYTDYQISESVTPLAPAISMDDVIFCYPHAHEEAEEKYHTFTVRDLHIQKDQLTMVIGETGSGKSSLLGAIMEELTLLSGRVTRTGDLAYVSQSPWVISGTLRENITFLKPYDQTRYRRIIEACALEADFALFPAGDQASVGEAGSNLSGGQRARVALARAMYSDASILLLDDPLAAVDKAVADRLFTSVVQLGKTVVLVTNQLSYLPRAQNVIVLEKNCVTFQGSSRQWMTERGAQLQFTAESGSDRTDDAAIQDNHKIDDTFHRETAAQAQDAACLIQAEEKASGDERIRLIKYYGEQIGGRKQCALIAVTVILLTVCRAISNYWFVWWAEDRLQLASNMYLAVYLGLIAVQALITGILGLILVRGSVRASHHIHDGILQNLLAAPYSFFQAQPVGRIVNRLSADVESIDAHIMNGIDGLLMAGTTLVASLALVVTAAPYSVIAMLPYVFITFWIQNRFRKSAGELKRTLSILQSSVLSLVSEVLVGSDTIRAYQGADAFFEKYYLEQDRVLSASIMRSSLDTWLTTRAELASLLLLVVVGILGQQGVIPTVEAGLALGTCINIAKNVDLMAWAVTTLEIELNSIERLQHYHEFLPREGNIDSGCSPEILPAEWPFNSRIQCHDACLRYPSREQNALDHITLDAGEGERIGIVGRTGCGKSTLLSALPRLIDLTGGTISIDGVDIRKIPLSRLRNAVTTLPQEPLLFHGSLRDNLDPKEQHRDEELLEALRVCNVDAVFALPEAAEQAKLDTSGLQMRVESGGSNMSAGQRQLVCAARTVLQKPRVLLVDEANANIDAESDIWLQQALQNLPPTTTILAISHRASSLAWMDRILVMDGGKIVEQGHPIDLLQQADSQYRRVVRQEGALETAQGWLK
ncbi:hypothetical protein AWENTII_008891 [Aspergillus wentii]